MRSDGNAAKKGVSGGLATVSLSGRGGAGQGEGTGVKGLWGDLEESPLDPNLRWGFSRFYLRGGLGGGDAWGEQTREEEFNVVGNGIKEGIK